MNGYGFFFSVKKKEEKILIAVAADDSFLFFFLFLFYYDLLLIALANTDSFACIVLFESLSFLVVEFLKRHGIAQHTRNHTYNVIGDKSMT